MAVATVGAGIFSVTPTAKRLSGQLSAHPQKEVLNQTSHAFNEIAKRAMPSVVSIAVIKRMDEREMAEELAPLLRHHDEKGDGLSSHLPSAPPLNRGELPVRWGSALA